MGRTPTRTLGCGEDKGAAGGGAGPSAAPSTHPRYHSAFLYRSAQPTPCYFVGRGGRRAARDRDRSARQATDDWYLRRREVLRTERAGPAGKSHTPHGNLKPSL